MDQLVLKKETLLAKKAELTNEYYAHVKAQEQISEQLEALDVLIKAYNND